MRTTLTLDDDLFTVAKMLAREKSESIGKAISDLARIGLNANTSVKARTKTGFPVFSIPKGAKIITLEDIKKLEDDV